MRSSSSSSSQDAQFASSLNQSNQSNQAEVTNSVQSLNVLTRNNINETTSLIGEIFLADSDLATSGMAGLALTQLYFDTPRIIAVSSTFTFDTTTQVTSLTYGIDILSDAPRVVVAPGQSEATGLTMHFLHGFSDSVIEGQVLGAGQTANGMQTSSAMSTFQAAIQAGPVVLLLSVGDLPKLDSLPLSAEAKVRITAAVENGFAVEVPTVLVTVNGQPTTAWLQIDSAGNAIAVSEDGTHSGGLAGMAGAYDIATTEAAVGYTGGTTEGAIAGANVAADEGGLLVIEEAEQQALAKGLARPQVKKAVFVALFQYEANVGTALLAFLAPLTLRDCMWISPKRSLHES